MGGGLNYTLNAIRLSLKPWAHTFPWATFPFPNWNTESSLPWCWTEPADAVQHPLEHFPASLRQGVSVSS